MTAQRPPMLGLLLTASLRVRLFVIGLASAGDARVSTGKMLRLFRSHLDHRWYHAELLIGTPPQRVAAAVDLSVDFIALACRRCDPCREPPDPAFDVAASSSAEWVGCDDVCPGSCQDGKHCEYAVDDADGTSMRRWLFKDQFRFGNEESVKATLGCTLGASQAVRRERPTALMGFRPSNGGGTPAILEDLLAGTHGEYLEAFSLCLAEWGGELVLGGSNAARRAGASVDIPIIPGTSFEVPLSAMLVGGRMAGMGSARTTMNSGIPRVRVPTAAYRELIGGIEAHCRRNGNCGATQDGPCWSAPTGVAGFPSVQFQFGESTTMWVPQAYLARRGGDNRSGTWCYAFEDSGPHANVVLGASWFLHQEVLFDLARLVVTVAPAACPEPKPGAQAAQEHLTSSELDQEEAVTLAGAIGRRPVAVPGDATASETRKLIGFGFGSLVALAFVVWLVALLATGNGRGRRRGAGSWMTSPAKSRRSASTRQRGRGGGPPAAVVGQAIEGPDGKEQGEAVIGDTANEEETPLV